MSISTVVVHGTTGPVYEALLALVLLWTDSNELPEVLEISAPRGNRIVVTTSHNLATFLENTFNMMGASLSRQEPMRWPGRTGDPPSSVRAERLS